MLELGARAKDQITGFTGVVTGMCQYISGCNQVLLIPPVKADGDLISGQWFDVQRVAVLEGERVVLNNGGTPGPDAPPSRSI